MLTLEMPPIGMIQGRWLVWDDGPCHPAALELGSDRGQHLLKRFGFLPSCDQDTFGNRYGGPCPGPDLILPGRKRFLGAPVLCAHIADDGTPLGRETPTSPGLEEQLDFGL